MTNKQPKFYKEDLQILVQKQRKHNLFNWVSPNSEYWLKTILKLILEIFLITWVVFTLVFILFNLIPGEPKLITDAKQKGDPQTIMALQDLFHIGPSYGFFNRYFYALKQMFDGTLGISWTTGQIISDVFWQRLSISISIGALAIGFSALFGIPIGIFLARRETSFSDFIAAIVTLLAFSIPSFVIALLIVGINTAMGLPTVFEYGNIFMYLMPALIIAIPVGFGYSRYLRSSIRKEYSEQYVSLARIKGVSENKILWKHIFKPSLFPIVNYLPFVVIGALFGSITIESVFSIPGTGQMLINASLEHDQSSLLAITTIYTFFTVISFFVRDLLIKFVDPRTRGE